MRSYEIDYDEISECTEPLDSHKVRRTAKGNEISPAKMPLMRIRSVEIVFEDEMSTCTDTGLLDRSIELIVTDSSDDSTKCVDDIEPQIEKDNDSVTLNNGDGELSDDNSVSLEKDEVNDSSVSSAKDVEQEIPIIEIENIPKMQDGDDSNLVQSDVPSATDDITLSYNISEMVDSGRFTEEACSSHFETIPITTYDDALLSHSFDLIDVEITSTVPTVFETPVSIIDENLSRLYEYIDSNSDSSDDTAVCDVDNTQIQHNLTPLSNTMAQDEDDTVDCSDLQYDSFVDMGKF